MPLTPLPPLPDVLPPEVTEDGTLVIEAIDDGQFLERANAAWLVAMREAIRREGKASVTLSLIVTPTEIEVENETAEEDEDPEMQRAFKVATKVRMNLPDVKCDTVLVPDSEGRIRTDVRVVRHVLRPIGPGRFVNQHGEETDDAGIVVVAESSRGPRRTTAQG